MSRLPIRVRMPTRSRPRRRAFPPRWSSSRSVICIRPWRSFQSGIFSGQAACWPSSLFLSKKILLKPSFGNNSMPPFGNAQLKLLERLCNVIAVSGDEADVRRIVLEEIKPYAQEVKVDALGNVLAVRSGRGSKRMRVMLDAHMDEVGFMIVADDGEGIYRFENVGGIDVRHLVGKQV